MKSAMAGMLVAAALALFLPAPALAAGLKLRDSSLLAAAGPAPAPAAAPSSAPGPAPPSIRPGVVVRITTSKDELMKAFDGQPIEFRPLMEDMLGKDFVVKELKYGGAGLSSPDGTQDNTWYFPLAALTAWKDTPDAKEIPVAAKGFKAMGLPTSPKAGIVPPGRNDAPWDYTIKTRGLMDPIAPPHNERVDFEKTSMQLPPWQKVKQVVSVECLEKLHKDPSHLCEPEAYANYNAVTLAPTTAKPLSQKEAKALKDKIRHLESTIDSLSSPPAQKTKVTFKVPGSQEVTATMNAAIGSSNQYMARDGGGKKMKIGAKASDERMHTAHNHGQPPVVDHPL